MNAAQIVLIEDNPADIFLIELALKEHGIIYEMTKFRSGQEALASLCPPEGATTAGVLPDLILLDLNTPKSDGFEVLGKIKQTQHLADVPVAIISSSSSLVGDQTGILGATRYIQKPSQLDEFLSKVGQGVKEMLANSIRSSDICP